MIKTEIADPFDVIRFVIMTEKAINNIDSQNKITFIVNRSKTKQEIKQAVESLMKTKIKGIRTVIDQKARKKAFITFRQPGEAGELAIKLGII